MKKIFTLSCLAALIVFFCPVLYAQVNWNFTTASPTSNAYSNITVGDISQGNNNGTTALLTAVSVSSGYAGASGGNNAGLAANTSGYDPSLTGYFQVVLTPTGSNSVVLTGISFGSRSTATGPQAISVRTSVDGYAADQLALTVPSTSAWVFRTGVLNVTGIAGTPVTVRIYGYNGTGSPGSGTANWRIDDLTINPGEILPLNLLSFNAGYNGRSAKLSWSTANEQNVEGFSVQKSLNGQDFEALTFIKASGGQTQNAYSTEDFSVREGINYYRLQITDRNGAVKFSRVVTVKNSNLISTQLYPNPVLANVMVTHPKASKAAIRIVNVEGRLFKVIPVQSGALQTNLELRDLTKGHYVLIFEDGASRSSTSFVKQ